VFVSVLLVISLAGPAHDPTADVPLLEGSTPKSMSEFGSCFASIEQAQSRPLSFVPYENGGRISNQGANGVRNPYQIRFTEGHGQSRIEAFIGSRGGPEERPLVDAIRRCW
jgi:hypothetical protein